MDGDPGAEDRPGPWRRCGVHPLDVPTLRQEGGPDLSQLLRAGPRPRRARATTRRGGETWRQRLTATPRPTSAGTSSVLWSLRRWWRTPRSTRPCLATAAARAFPGAAVKVQWPTGEVVWKTRSA